jgi:peroxiredoxin
MAFQLAIGSKAPNFQLPGSDGKTHSFLGENSVKGSKGTLIFFTCNHCPYVVGSEDRMVEFFAQCEAVGVAMVAIHSNETLEHPTDAFPFVIERMKDKGFPWLSLDDSEQKIARAYGAQRTPHYFLFNGADQLIYSGRMDNSPRDASRQTTHELADALADFVAGKPVQISYTDAIGCNVKWWDKDGHWMPADACDLDYLDAKFKS